MKRLLRLDQDTGRAVEVNVTNLVDCMLFLLIFFIVNARFVQEPGVPIQKPRAVSAETLDKASVLLALTADGKIYYGGRLIPFNSVRGLVAHYVREQDVPVVIVADEASRSGYLIQLVDECKLAGARQVSVAARRDSSP